MKHFYLIFTLLFSLLVCGQTPFTSTTVPTDYLLPYGETTSYPGQGEYQIFLGAGNTNITKPIILVDGFDPGDSRNITGLYNSLNFDDAGTPSNLADILRADGYDIILLNFPVYTRAADGALIDGGTDFMERNAMLLVDLINIVNGQKVGDEENVIIGPSMGGLISRYALNFMESVFTDSETRLFISFDAPHLGANVPIGLQHQFNYLAFGLGGNNIVDLQPVVEGFLKGNAARQLLTDHFESHLLSNSDVDFDPGKVLPEPHPFKVIFDANINALTTTGFPETVRNVSIINGSGIGSAYQDKLGNDIAPGFNLIDDTFNIDAIFAVSTSISFTPISGAGQQLVSSITLLVNGNPNPLANVQAEAFDYTNGIDAASGGLYALSDLTGSIDPTSLGGQAVAALNTDFISFIPSVSAMALEITNDEIDWYHDIDLGTPGRATTNNTPFANWYMPDDNQVHVAITPANAQFALDEINQSTLSITGLDSSTEIRLERNPVLDQVTVLSNASINNATISMTDMTGKTVFNSVQDINSRTTIPVYLKSGLYILNIETPDRGNFITKVIIK